MSEGMFIVLLSLFPTILEITLASTGVYQALLGPKRH